MCVCVWNTLTTWQYFQITFLSVSTADPLSWKLFSFVCLHSDVPTLLVTNTTRALVQDCNDFICLCVHREETRPSKWYVHYCFPVINFDTSKTRVRPLSDGIYLVCQMGGVSGLTKGRLWYIHDISMLGWERMVRKAKVFTSLALLPAAAGLKDNWSVPLASEHPGPALQAFVRRLLRVLKRMTASDDC